MRVVFFKTPKPKQFSYTPRYYNPDKEALMERQQQIKQEMGLSDENTPRVSLIKGQLRRQYESRRKRGIKVKNTRRLIIILAILLLLAYYMFYL